MLKSGLLCLFFAATIVASQNDCQTALQLGMVACMEKYPVNFQNVETPGAAQALCKGAKSLTDCLRVTYVSGKKNECSGDASGGQAQASIDDTFAQYEQLCAQFTSDDDSNFALETKCGTLTGKAAATCRLMMSPEYYMMLEQDKKETCETVRKGTECLQNELRGQGCESTQTMKSVMETIAEFDQMCVFKNE